ncbi:fibronectin type III domain-containing protein [Sphingobacterium chuzhouense]|uniref:Fibronectin type III domain-containing protein n=1 Tax=Sphingobacterium chuzhouense TaxID=1742264 RepID=A0ABR7XPS5_9SPHI|nr:fibronectin type III domain-containing protein [Sphingobacterium chuzhouense]MBD1421143.1 fibronectin type III domain-containing protein [Sphingobacterium chuzhouense]
MTIKNINLQIKDTSLFLVALCILWASVGCSKDVQGEVGSALPQPENFTITPASKSATFEWSAVEKADGYFLEVGTNSSFSEIVAKTDTTQQTKVQFNGLTPATFYYARLRAIHKTNPSFTSNRLVETFTTAEEEQPELALAFPGADGYGKMTTGGRGGKVIKVTNLSDAGTGSLRAAIEQSGSRIIVFEVSGNIKLNSRLRISNGDVTIAGQTAPGDGICIQDHEMVIAADNVILRFLRFRMGDLTRNEQDALWGRYQKNIVIDHCSMSWSIDECSSFYANKDFTMQWCILAESLNKSFHEKDDHGYGGIWGGHQASFHHNLLAHHNSRNPRFDGGNRPGTGGLNAQIGADKVDYRNNVVYNWRGNSAYGGENGEYNIVDNYYKSGPATPSSKQTRIMQISKENNADYSPGHGVFFIEGNHVFGNANVTMNNWAGGVDFDSSVSIAQAQRTTPFPFQALRTQHTAEQAYEQVLEKAGASYKRDAVDQRVVKEVKDGTTTYNGSKTGFPGIIDSQTDVGGWPTLAQTTPPTDTDGDGIPDAWEIANNLDPNIPNANGRDLSEVYDNIEMYFNSLVEELY